MSIILRFFPNGEFSHGVDTSLQRRDKKRRDRKLYLKLTEERRDAYLQYQARVHPSLLHWADCPINTQFVSPHLYTYTLRESSKTHCVLEWRDVRGQIHRTSCGENIAHVCFHWNLAPLVHQLIESCDKPKSRKTLMSMTKPMARNIRNGVYLLEQQPGGKDVLSFLTLTLPALSADGLRLCCKNWDTLVKQFMDWLRITLHRKGIEFQYVYCTEIQTKRLDLRHEYAPHLHIVFRGRNGKKCPWAITPKQARKAWKRSITSVVDERFNDSALENLQRIKYSAARYLAKYLSKGTSNVPVDTGGNPTITLRTQWGGMSRKISRAIRQTITRYGGSAEESELALCILANMGTFIGKKLVKYYAKGFITLGIDKTTGMEYGLHVGCGCLRTPTFEGGLIPVIDYVHRLTG